MKIESLIKSIFIGLVLGFISVSPIIIFKSQDSQYKKINYNSNVTKSHIIASSEQVIAKYGGLGLIQEIYENNHLVSIKCFACNNEKNFICKSCLGSGLGDFVPRTVLVHSYVKRNGTRVRAHYRRSPGARSRCYTCNGAGKIRCKNCLNYYE